jgi:hypothetical protein
MEVDICEEMEGLGSIPKISAVQVGDVLKPEKSMGFGSSDTQVENRVANCLNSSGISERSLPQ